MARGSVQVCSQCGFSSAQWHGQCPGCGEWNTLVEERLPAAGGSGGSGGRRGLRSVGGAHRQAAAAPKLLREVGAAPVQRICTGIAELDRVLGGGIVPGSLVLLGGSPGIGKSTLTNMALGHLAGAGRSTLYVSGEESAEQVRLRAERLSAEPGRPALDVPVLAETDLELALEALSSLRPDVCVIDSVQTLRSGELFATGVIPAFRGVAAPAGGGRGRGRRPPQPRRPSRRL